MIEPGLWVPRVIGMGAMLVLSATFSASETAVFSIRAKDRRTLRERGRLARLVHGLLSRPRDLLISLLLGNLLINLGFFALSAALSLRLDQHGSNQGAIYVALGSFVALLLAGEIFPKILAGRMPVTVAQICVIPVSLFLLVSRPVVFVLSSLVGLVTGGLLAVLPKPMARSAHPLKTLLDMSVDRGEIDRDEKGWLDDVIEFSRLRVRDVMVPRVDVASIDLNGSREEAIAVAMRSKFSKLPAHEGSLDSVRGYIRGPDLFLRPATELASLVRPVFFCPETTKLEPLLLTMRREGHTIAIAVDEYGGCEGLLTLEDIIHEIVGELSDEYTRVSPRLRRVGSGRYILPGTLPIREWNELLNPSLPEDLSVGTVGGYVVSRLDRAPQIGDQVDHENVRFVVRRQRRGRILVLEARLEEGALG